MRERKKIEKLIDDYFHDQIPSENFEEAILALTNSLEEDDIDRLMRGHWNEQITRQIPSKEEFNLLLDLIHHQLNLLEDRKNEKNSGTKWSNRNYRNIFNYVSKIAAILFIPLLITTLFYFSEHSKREEEYQNIRYSEVYTPMAAKTKFILPDSTVVWLNSGSTLNYPTMFTGKTREVFLTGEGYFEVAKNLKIPFIVKTAKMNITALGTSFNVMAYPDDQQVSATLVTGKIKVEKTDNGASLYLKPSDQVVLDEKTGKMSTSRIETRFYTSWKEGKLIFRDEPLEAVARKLERWFNCTIHINDQRLKELRYTGNIEMETLRELLELINVTSPIKSTYKPETREIWLEKR